MSDALASACFAVGLGATVWAAGPLHRTRRAPLVAIGAVVAVSLLSAPRLRGHAGVV